MEIEPNMDMNMDRHPIDPDPIDDDRPAYDVGVSM